MNGKRWGVARAALVYLAAWSCVIGFPAADAKETFTIGLDLENAASHADLIVAARVSEVTELKTVHGGKAVEVTQQFRFQPIRVLKGVFARPELLLTDQDLGQYRSNDEFLVIEKGQIRLLFLGRSDRGYINANQVNSLDRSLPLLAGMEDPLLKSVETLLELSHETNRFQRVKLLVKGLERTEGRGAVALLNALARRSVVGAQTPGGIDAPLRFLDSKDDVLREAAARTVGELLEDDYLQQEEPRARARDALASALLDRHVNHLASRVAIIDALGSVGKLALVSDRARKCLDLAGLSSKTAIAERAAVIRAIGKTGDARQVERLIAFYNDLPLDAPDALESAATFALDKIGAVDVSTSLLGRFGGKHQAGLEARPEIDLTARLPEGKAEAALLEVGKANLTEGEWASFASACRQKPKPTYVTMLEKLIDPRRPAVRWIAVEALLAIDNERAALALRPHLAEEWDLNRKLRIAEFLGKFGFHDGYPYAIEHLSEGYLTEQAAAAIAAIKDSAAVDELKNILAKSNDLAWNTGAIRALGKLGGAGLRAKFLELAKDPHNPLSKPALLALADMQEKDAVPIVKERLSARDQETVATAALAAGTLLLGTNVQADGVRDELASLLADPEANSMVRYAALDALEKLNDARLEGALRAAAADARIEHQPLLERVETTLAARKFDLGLGLDRRAQPPGLNNR